jgi:hypothetical protein
MKALITIETTVKPERKGFLLVLRQSEEHAGRFSVHHLEQLLFSAVTNVTGD